MVPSDRRKLDEYLQSIRDIERRIQVAMEKKPVDLPDVTRPAGIPDSWPEHVKIMFDLQALALQADLTRVWTFMYAARGIVDDVSASRHLDGASRDLAS